MQNRPISFVPLLAASALFSGSVFAELDFEKEVWPFLEAKCVDCHREPYEDGGRTKNPKAGLRLDGDWAIFSGSENGKVLEPGNAEESYLYEVVTLPKDDDMFMPTKGDALTAKEMELLKQWIEEGADFGGWTGNQNGRPADFSFEAAGEPEAIEAPVSPYDALAEGATSPSEEAVKVVEDAGGRVTPLAPDFPLVRVDYISSSVPIDDAAVGSLSEVAESVAQLDLAKTEVTSAVFEQIGKMDRLRTLDLHSTSVGDSGLEHLTELKNLSYLNLYDTEVSDAAIGTLGELKWLESLYLWQSKVTPEGAKKLEKLLPDTKVSIK